MYHIVQDHLIIDCKVSGNPRPTILWQKNDEPIEFDARIQQVERGDGVCELIINRPIPTDNATYSCIATNALGEQTATHLVDFQPPPNSSAHSRFETGTEESESKAAEDAEKAKKAKEEPASYTRRYVQSPEDILKAALNKLSFVTHLTNRVFPVGSKIKLTCVIQGPDPNVKWFKNENPVVYGSRIRNMSRESFVVLEIAHCTLEDAGEYNCIIRNTECVISTACKLQVYDPLESGTGDLSPTFTRSLKGQLMN